jgi:hypothetical protein
MKKLITIIKRVILLPVKILAWLTKPIALKVRDLLGRDKARRFFAWLTLLLIQLAIGFSLTLFGAFTQYLTPLIIGPIILAWLAFWAPMCIKEIGSTETPERAVMIRLGTPVAAFETGLQIRYWPIERMVRYPTKQYLLDFALTGVHSKRETKKDGRQYSTFLMGVDVAIYFSWPKGGHLIQAFRKAPTPTGNFEDDTKMLTEFFGPAVDDAVRNIMVKYNHEECREKKEEIEKEVKEYFLKEKGNPFKESGIQEEDLDVAIKQIKFTERAERSFEIPEMGQREAESREAMMKMLKNHGIPPILAGAFLQEGEAKGLSTQELMHLVITMRLLGISLGTSTSSSKVEKLREKLREISLADKEAEVLSLLTALEII